MLRLPQQFVLSLSVRNGILIYWTKVSEGEEGEEKSCMKISYW